MDLEQAIEQSYQAWVPFTNGDPQPIMLLFSHADDVTLANPFGPAVRGWEQVSETLTYASSRLRSGESKRFERLATYSSPTLATILDIEHWEAKVGDQERSPFELRVTSTFRLEDGAWKIVSRHADPIMTFDPEGPVRRSVR